MIKNCTLLALLSISTITFASDAELITRAERTDFLETSLYSEVVDFVNAAASRSPKLRVSHPERDGIYGAASKYGGHLLDRGSPDPHSSFEMLMP
jgi:hypothetical protein